MKSIVLPLVHQRLPKLAHRESEAHGSVSAADYGEDHIAVFVETICGCLRFRESVSSADLWTGWFVFTRWRPRRLGAKSVFRLCDVLTNGVLLTSYAEKCGMQENPVCKLVAGFGVCSLLRAWL